MIGEFAQTGAGELEDGDRRAENNNILFGIEPSRSQQRVPELGRQRGSALDTAQDSIRLTIRQ
jgi:hypothetical protein